MNLLYSTIQKSVVGKIFNFFKTFLVKFFLKKYLIQQGCICLIKNTEIL